MSDSKPPPANIEAEEAILGGILLDPGAMSRIEAQLHPQAFCLLAHQEIYQIALRLYHQGKPTDLMAVSNYLADRERLEQIGGMSKLSQLLNRTVSAVNIDRYVDLVMDKFLRRKVIEAGHNVVNLGYDITLELDALLDCSQKEVLAISQQKIKSDTEHNSEIAAVVFHQLEEHTPIYSTGINELDRLMVGFEPGNMTILAARPSTGKSAISLFMTLHISLQYQLPVVIFSLEMTKKQLEYRLWSLMSLLECYQHLNLTPIASDHAVPREARPPSSISSGVVFSNRKRNQQYCFNCRSGCSITFIYQ
jgi:replicative DNA helicase